MSFARVRALAIVGVLVTCAAILVAVTLFKDRQRDTVVDTCPSGSVVVDLTFPEPKDVKITTFNGMGNSVTVYSTSVEFGNRQFQVTQSKETVETTEAVAILRYGPQAVSAAWLVNAYFLGLADLEFDIDRTDDTVDVIFGTNFRKLATSTEVSQAVAQLGRATAPPGTCGQENGTSDEDDEATGSSASAESSSDTDF